MPAWPAGFPQRIGTRHHVSARACNSQLHEGEQMVKIGGREVNDWLVVALAMLAGLAFSTFLVYGLPALLR